MLRDSPISSYLIIAAPGGCCCKIICNHYLHWIDVSLSVFCFFSSPDVQLTHDATCVPSTCSDNDGHPERSSTIVPGEPTGQRFHQNSPQCSKCQLTHLTHARTSRRNILGPENLSFSCSYCVGRGPTQISYFLF